MNRQPAITSLYLTNLSIKLELRSFSLVFSSSVAITDWPFVIQTIIDDLQGEAENIQPPKVWFLSNVCRLLSQTLHTCIESISVHSYHVLLSKLVCMLEIGATGKFRFEIFKWILHHGVSWSFVWGKGAAALRRKKGKDRGRSMVLKVGGAISRAVNTSWLLCYLLMTMMMMTAMNRSRHPPTAQKPMIRVFSSSVNSVIFTCPHNKSIIA